MRRSDASHPSRAFTEPRREAMVEVLIVVEPDPSIPPDEFDRLLEEVVERTDRALTGAFDGLSSRVRVDDVGISGPHHVPVFPAKIGGVVYEVSTDVYEAVNSLRRGTSLEGLMHDSAGRAFACSVWCYFRRTPEADRPVDEVWDEEPPEPEG